MQNFLEGRSVLRARPLAANEADGFTPFSRAVLPEAPTPGEEEHEHDAPQIDLVEENGRIEKIIVTCSCGRRTELECSY